MTTIATPYIYESIWSADMNRKSMKKKLVLYRFILIPSGNLFLIADNAFFDQNNARMMCNPN